MELKIGIIGAMEEEVAILRNNIQLEREETVAGCDFVLGKLQDKDVVLLRSGIGKVNAAMSTTILMEKFHPDVLINTGSAGGYNPKLNVGDIVVSSEVRHHDVDVTIFGYEYGQVPKLPAAFKADETLIQTALKAAETIHVRTVTGLITTGDSFMNDPDRVQFVRDMFLDIQAAEMEGAAIAQVAYQYQIPFVIIRSLSDIAGEESHISFEQFLETAAQNSSQLVINMIKELD